MQLLFSGVSEIALPRRLVWSRLMDPQTVAACAPGVEAVETVGPNQYKVISAFGVGAVKLRFTMQVELSDIVEPESAQMRARGKAPGSAVDARTSIRLVELGPNLTRLDWSAETDFSGTVASVGARLLKGTARKLTQQFWEEFARQAVKARSKT